MITEVVMGGRLAIQTTADACISKEEAARQAEMEACAAYDAKIKSAEGCASSSISQEDNSEASSEASTCNLKVEGGDLSQCRAGSCGEGMCDNDAWAASIGEQFQSLSPLSFQLKSISEVIKEFDQSPHTLKLIEVLDAKIQQKWEAAARTATNAQIDDSACEQKTTQVNGCLSNPLDSFVVAVIFFAFVWQSRHHV